MEATTTQRSMSRDEHPSNLLYRGEAGGDFRQAMRLVVAQCRREKELSRKHLREWGLEADESDLSFRQSMNEYAGAARECLSEYQKALRRFEEELAEKWIASDDDNKQLIGEALKDRDYSQLAI